MGSDICTGAGSVRVNQEHNNNRKEPSLIRIKTNVAIKSKATNKVLDICQDQDAYGTLIIYDDCQQANQRFDILQAEEYVYIVNCKSGKYLTVGSNSDKNYAPIFQQPISGVKGQKFRLQKIEGNMYYIHTFCGKILDCNGTETGNGTRVVQYDCTRQDDQKWIIQ